VRSVVKVSVSAAGIASSLLAEAVFGNSGFLSAARYLISGLRNNSMSEFMDELASFDYMAKVSESVNGIKHSFMAISEEVLRNTYGVKMNPEAVIDLDRFLEIFTSAAAEDWSRVAAGNSKDLESVIEVSAGAGKKCTTSFPCTPRCPPLLATIIPMPCCSPPPIGHPQQRAP
jgi:hypothetical protein